VRETQWETRQQWGARPHTRRDTHRLVLPGSTYTMDDTPGDGQQLTATKQLKRTQGGRSEYNNDNRAPLPRTSRNAVCTPR
jgi:hypothetical protein